MTKKHNKRKKKMDEWVKIFQQEERMANGGDVQPDKEVIQIPIIFTTPEWERIGRYYTKDQVVTVIMSHGLYELWSRIFQMEKVDAKAVSKEGSNET
jgi:hypothetical protein